LASENKFVFLNFFNSVTTSVRCMLMQGTHKTHKGQPGNQLSVQAGRLLRNIEKGIRKKCKFKAPAWPAKLNPGQAFVRERYRAF
jgi:hypothetical protein